MMKRLMVVLALLSFLGCQDADPIHPDSVIAPELEVVEAAQAQGDLLKMVPLKVNGTWWQGGIDMTPCEGDNEAFRMLLTLEGTGTHLGHMTGSGTNCLRLNSDGSFVFLSQASSMTAANGDELHAYGLASGGTVYTVNPDGSWVLGPIPLVGGTGRFENAEGTCILYGSGTGDTGTFRTEGWVSSVGLSK